MNYNLMKTRLLSTAIENFMTHAFFEHENNGNYQATSAWFPYSRYDCLDRCERFQRSQATLWRHAGTILAIATIKIAGIEPCSIPAIHQRSQRSGSLESFAAIQTIVAIIWKPSFCDLMIFFVIHNMTCT